MKSTLPLLSSLFLGAMAALPAAPSPDARMVIASAAGARLDSHVTKGGGTDNMPLIRADGSIALLQVRHVTVQRPTASAPAGSLIGSSVDRPALKAFMAASAGIVTPPGKGRRGWPEGEGYLSLQPHIERLQIDNVVAEGLEQVLEHQAGTIKDLDLRELSLPAATKTVHKGEEAAIGETRQPVDRGKQQR